MDEKQLQAAVQEAAKDGRISCHDARRLAEELNVSYSEVGRACDVLGIKIQACELGCF